MKASFFARFSTSSTKYSTLSFVDESASTFSIWKTFVYRIITDGPRNALKPSYDRESLEWFRRKVADEFTALR